MDVFTLAFWIIGVVLFLIAIIKKREKTVAAMGKSRRMMGSMISDIVAIILLIGLVLTIIPPRQLKNCSARPMSGWLLPVPLLPVV
jgi:hypothetical protein